RVTMLLIGITLLAAVAGCAKKAAEAPPAPPPAPAPAEAPPPTPPPAPEPTPAPPTPAPEVAFQDAFFDFDSYALRSDAQAAMDGNVKKLRDASALHVMIEGHCDERGTVEYNLALGERRANAAKDYLVTAGVSASRIETVSYGKERPFDMGHDETAWA